MPAGNLTPNPFPWWKGNKIKRRGRREIMERELSASEGNSLRGNSVGRAQDRLFDFAQDDGTGDMIAPTGISGNANFGAKCE